MTLENLANWFNIGATLIVMALSLLAMRFHPRPYFGRWVLANGFGIGVLVSELLASHFGPLGWVRFVEVAFATAAAYVFAELGEFLRGNPWRRWWFWPWMAGFLGSYVLLYARGLPFELAFVPVVVAVSLAQVYCGARFLAYGTAFGRRTAWQGWPQIALGLWIFSYPVLQPTPYFWVGFLVSALLHVLVSTSMLLYLLEDAVAEVATRNEQLVRAAEHKRTFLSIVSHELRTPLTALMGYHELLEDEVPGPLTAEQQTYLVQMRQSAGQLAGLIDSLLDSFQLESGTLRVHQEAVDLPVTIGEALGPLRAMLTNRGLELQLDVPADLPRVLGDQQRIVQLVNNLVSNAAKFTEPRGRIALAAGVEGSFVRVEVADTGVGIAPEKLPHVFDAFYQADNSLTRRHGGSGLGLSIVRELVVRMGGTVGVESEPGHGSRFWFTLPLSG